MSGAECPLDARQRATVAMLGEIARAREELSAALVAAGIDPEDWGSLADPARYTRENRRRLAKVARRMAGRLITAAWETER